MKIIKSSGKLVIKLSFWEKILAIHGNVEIPTKNVVSIDKERPPLWTSWWELRLPGSFLPGIAKMGTYYTVRGKEFWLWVRGKKFNYTIELKNEKYKRIVFSSNQKISI